MLGGVSDRETGLFDILATAPKSSEHHDVYLPEMVSCLLFSAETLCQLYVSCLIPIVSQSPGVSRSCLQAILLRGGILC